VWRSEVAVVAFAASSDICVVSCSNHRKRRSGGRGFDSFGVGHPGPAFAFAHLRLRLPFLSHLAHLDVPAFELPPPQVADLLTPNSTSAELALNGGLTSSPSSAGISGHRQPSGQPSKRLKAGCAGGVSGAASANPVLHTSMAPPPAPPAVARHSVLRSKRPAGATDLNLIRPENSAFENSLQSTGFPSGSLPSNTSLAGYLDSPAMLNQFAAQMSPKVGEQFGLTPNAMLDFLTTDDMLAQISSCASAEEERIESGSPAVGASPD